MRKLSLLLLLLMLQLAMYGRSNKALSLSQSPLSFIENKGQIRDQHGNLRTDIDFVLQTRGMVLYVGKGQLHYQFIKENPKDTTHYTRENPPEHYQVSPGYTTYRLDVSLEGANASAKALKGDPQTAKYHYYTNGTQEGITGVQSYNKITYKDIYPGIDWVLYTKDGHLKYDFVLRPGAKLSDIRLNYAGASGLSLTKDGSLRITTPLGDLEEEAPYSYEQDTKKAVSSRYLLNGNTVSLVAGAYKGALVIDPTVEWATYFGAAGSETGGAFAVDSLSAVYICGNTTSTTGIATSGAFQASFGGGYYDAYLAKFDSTGQLLWATYYGGGGTSGPLAGIELIVCVGIDRFGHVYLAGTTLSENNIATPGSFQPDIDPLPTNALYQDGFLAQFNNDGMRQWGTYYGASAHQTQLYAIACDNMGNVYVGGHSDSTTSLSNQLVSAGAHQTTYGGGQYDAILVKFDSSGSRQWATYYGGQGQDVIRTITCDDSNNVYIGGVTHNSPSGIATPGAYEESQPLWQADHEAGFVAKFTDAGVRQWGSYIGGSVYSLILDAFDHFYISGVINYSGGPDTLIYTPNGFQSTWPTAQFCGFLMQFNPHNCTRNWGTYYGAESNTSIGAVACDDFGNVFISGSTLGSSLTPEAIVTPGSYKDTFTVGTASSNGDAFIAMFDSAGARKWATYYGGAESDGGSVACAPGGVLYLCGGTRSTSGIATPGSYQDTLNGSAGDAFLVRWLPVDIGIKRETPIQDTVCTGEVPLSVLVSNNGRMDKTDDLVITYTYTGPSEGGDTLTFTDDLAAGASESYSLGAAALDYEGTYDFTVYLHYTRDDNERNNDTLHFSLTTTTAEPIANIEYSQIGTNYQFSNPDGLSSYTYHWDFGDGDTSNEATPTHSYVADGTYDVILIVTGWCGSDTAHLSLDAVGTGTAVSGIADDNLLTVYPNPAKGDLYLKAAGITMKHYEVVNTLGQTMLNGTLNGQQDKINVSGLAAGAYYIRIETNRGIAEKPFQVLR